VDSLPRAFPPHSLVGSTLSHHVNGTGLSVFYSGRFPVLAVLGNLATFPRPFFPPTFPFQFFLVLTFFLSSTRLRRSLRTFSPPVVPFDMKEVHFRLPLPFHFLNIRTRVRWLHTPSFSDTPSFLVLARMNRFLYNLLRPISLVRSFFDV